MRTRKDYEKALSVVREAINAWDPYGLIAGGSPLDEWESEVARIVARIPRIRSPADAAHVVSRIFSSSVEREGFSPEACTPVGSQLYEALVDAGILD